jgi:hypothetical protein
MRHLERVLDAMDRAVQRVIRAFVARSGHGA